MGEQNEDMDQRMVYIILNEKNIYTKKCLISEYSLLIKAVSVINYSVLFQYIFVSLLSRDSTYKLLKSVCGHLDVSTLPSPSDLSVFRASYSSVVNLVFRSVSIIAEYKCW